MTDHEKELESLRLDLDMCNAVIVDLRHCLKSADKDISELKEKLVIADQVLTTYKNMYDLAMDNLKELLPLRSCSTCCFMGSKDNPCEDCLGSDWWKLAERYRR